VIELLSQVRFASIDLALIAIAVVGALYVTAEMVAGVLMILGMLGLWAAAGQLTTGSSLVDAGLAAALLVAAFVFQTRVGHNVYEHGVDDTAMNVAELRRTKNPIPILLIFFYHLVELLFALGYRPALQREVARPPGGRAGPPRHHRRMILDEIWRYPREVDARRAPRRRSSSGPGGIPGDRVVHVEDARGKVVTSRSRPALLGHAGTLAADGEPLVDGLFWDDPAVAELVTRRRRRAGAPGPSRGRPVRQVPAAGGHRRLARRLRSRPPPPPAEPGDRRRRRPRRARLGRPPARHRRGGHRDGGVARALHHDDVRSRHAGARRRRPPRHPPRLRRPSRPRHPRPPPRPHPVGDPVALL
jgi:uncharacterized membrane protein YGL010W